MTAHLPAVRPVSTMGAQPVDWAVGTAWPSAVRRTPSSFATAWQVPSVSTTSGTIALTSSRFASGSHTARVMKGVTERVFGAVLALGVGLGAGADADAEGVADGVADAVVSGAVEVVGAGGADASPTVCTVADGELDASVAPSALQPLSSPSVTAPSAIRRADGRMTPVCSPTR